MSALKLLNIYTFWVVFDVDFNKREIKGNAYVNTSAVSGRIKRQSYENISVCNGIRLKLIISWAQISLLWFFLMADSYISQWTCQIPYLASNTVGLSAGSPISDFSYLPWRDY